MRIAVTATGCDLDCEVDPRFGRCRYFLIVETDDLSFEAVENANAALGGGAGIQSAQAMADKGVRQVLTGNCGPNAYQTLSAAGIEVIVGCSGRVRDVVEQHKAGRFRAVEQPNVASHFGMGGAVAGALGGAAGVDAGLPAGMGGGMGMGRGGGGMGRGMGRGGGRGMGRGMGRGGGGGGGAGRGAGFGAGLGAATPPGGGAAGASRPGVPPSAARPAAPDPTGELDALRQQADELTRQMEQIQVRIAQLAQEEKAGVAAARVDSQGCTGCGVCVEACPADAISLTDGLAVVDERSCTACGRCVTACPNEAIALV